MIEKQKEEKSRRKRRGPHLPIQEQGREPEESLLVCEVLRRRQAARREHEEHA